MLLPPRIATDLLNSVVKPILERNDPDNKKLEDLWNGLCGIQAAALSLLLPPTIGNTVHTGPFKGLKLPPEILTGLFGPVLLGTYESELHPALEKAISRGYETVVNVGCGVGYYAVGFACRLPNAKIIGYDTDEKTCAGCAKTAEINEALDRVTLYARACDPAELTRYEPEKTLLFVDIEGAEQDLLDPEQTPELKKMDIIVELHDCFRPGVSETILKRFEPTHTIEYVRNASKPYELADELGPNYEPDHFDGAALSWERRNGPTPWAIMIAKNA